MSNPLIVLRIQGKAFKPPRLGEAACCVRGALEQIAGNIRPLMLSEGVHLVVVVGSGNIAPGDQAEDHLGIKPEAVFDQSVLASAINAINLASAFDSDPRPVELMAPPPFAIPGFSELNVRRCRDFLEDGRLVIVAGVRWGYKMYPSMSAARMFAGDLLADLVVNGTGPDCLSPEARRFKTACELSTAAQKIPVAVVNICQGSALQRAIGDHFAQKLV